MPVFRTSAIFLRSFARSFPGRFGLAARSTGYYVSVSHGSSHFSAAPIAHSDGFFLWVILYWQKNFNPQCPQWTDAASEQGCITISGVFPYNRVITWHTGIPTRNWPFIWKDHISVDIINEQWGCLLIWRKKIKVPTQLSRFGTCFELSYRDK